MAYTGYCSSGFYPTGSPSPYLTTKASPLQYGDCWRTMFGSKGLQGLDIFSGTLPGSFRKWVSKAQHNLSWSWPIPKGWSRAIQETLYLLQLCILCLLYRWTFCSDSSCLGTNTVRNGRWICSLCGCHGCGIDQLTFWYTCVPEQTDSW